MSGCEGGRGEIQLSVIVRVLGSVVMMMSKHPCTRGQSALCFSLPTIDQLIFNLEYLSSRARNAQLNSATSRGKLFSYRYSELSVSASRTPTRDLWIEPLYMHIRVHTGIPHPRLAAALTPSPWTHSIPSHSTPSY
jgi:hypothetical protein